MDSAPFEARPPRLKHWPAPPPNFLQNNASTLPKVPLSYRWVIDDAEIFLKNCDHKEGFRSPTVSILLPAKTESKWELVIKRHTTSIARHTTSIARHTTSRASAPGSLLGDPIPLKDDNASFSLYFGYPPAPTEMADTECSVSI